MDFVQVPLYMLDALIHYEKHCSRDTDSDADKGLTTKRSAEWSSIESFYAVQVVIAKRE